MTHKWIKNSDGTWEKRNLELGYGFIYNSCIRCNERPGTKFVSLTETIDTVTTKKTTAVCEVCVNRKQMNSTLVLI